MTKKTFLWVRRQPPVQQAAKGAARTRTLIRTLRNGAAAVGAGVLIGAIGWELLETKTRGYWTQ